MSGQEPLTINEVATKGLNLPVGSSKRMLYDRGLAWIKEMVQDGRFAFADSKGKPPTVGAFESWIKSLRRQHPGRKIVGIGDNFHLYQDFAHVEGESRLRRISQAAKLLTTTYDMTLICPMEVPGTYLARGRRPDIKAIKGSTGPQYDANFNMAIYNDLIDLQENAIRSL